MLATIVVIIKVVLSYGLASFAPLGLVQRRELAMFTRLAHWIPAPASVQDSFEAYLKGSTILSEAWLRGSIHLVTTLTLLLCFLAVLRSILRARSIDGEASRLLFRYGLFFATAYAFSYPVYTSDFWLSVAWGRMIAVGQNPYYVEMSPAAIDGLPLSNWGDRMTYGPLWAAISGGLAWLAGRREWLEFFLFKGVLAGAWVGTLVLLRRIAALRSPRDEAVALCLFGWMPMSTLFAVAEGHNDIAMIFPLVLWLFLLRWQRYQVSGASLVASALIKYITAPLLAADLLAKRVLGRVTWRQYLMSMIPALVLGAAIFVPFVHDKEFLFSTENMRHWTFWTPGTALMELSTETGIWLPPRMITFFILAGCTALMVFYLFQFIRTKSFQVFLSLILAAIVTVLFTVVGHVWPWFVLWTLPLAALTWRSPLAWFALLMAAMTPFLNLHWLVGTSWDLRPVSGLIFYFMSFVLTIWIFVHYRLKPSRAADLPVEVPAE
jgi:hypothetical protein